MDEELLLETRFEKEREKELFRKRRKGKRKEKKRKKDILSYKHYEPWNKRFGAYYEKNGMAKKSNVSLKYWKKVANRRIRGERIFEESFADKGSSYKRKNDLWTSYYW